MTQSSSDENCGNCIHWDGDSNWERGLCNYEVPADKQSELRTTRFDVCIDVAIRNLPDVFS